MASNIPTAISDQAEECVKKLEYWKMVDKKYASRADDAISLFRIWCINNFVFTRDQMCLDWRLRNIPVLSASILSLFKKLSEAVNGALDNIPQSQTDQNVTAQTGSNTTNPSLLASEDIDDIQKRLFGVCEAVHRSGVLSRLSKLSHWKPHESQDSTKQFREFVSRLIETRLSKAKCFLKPRLVDSIVLRRNNFLYLQQRDEVAHEVPLPGHVESTSRSSQLHPVPEDEVMEQKAQNEARHANMHSQQTESGANAPHGSQSRSTFRASTANASKYKNTAHSTRSSSTRGVGIASGIIDAMIPAPPKPIGSTDYISCPYCFLVCNKDQIEKKNWRRHFMRDLMPYICLLDDCPQPDVLFETSRDWLNHMSNRHPIITWNCGNRSHRRRLRFSKPSEIKEHMLTDHAEYYKDSEDIDDLVELSKVVLPRENPLNDCPLCQGQKDTTFMSMSDLLDHIAEHLVELAILSLPEEQDGAEDWSAKTQTPNVPTMGSIDASIHFTPPDDEANPPDIANYVHTDDEPISPSVKKVPDDTEYPDPWNNYTLWEAENPHKKLAQKNGLEKLLQLRQEDGASPEDGMSEFEIFVKGYITRHHCYGVNAMEKREFVPLSALIDFWTDERIMEALNFGPNSVNAPGIDMQQIRAHKLRVIAILSSVPFFRTTPGFLVLHLTDEKLPSSANELTPFFRTGSTKEPIDESGIEDFVDRQWRFCPLEFYPSAEGLNVVRGLHPCHIIPVNNMQPLEGTEDDDVTVQRAEWHASCLGGLPFSTIVLKTYRVHAEYVSDMLQHEMDCYEILSNKGSAHIIRCYGCIEQGNKSMLLLENAGGGSLAQFFEGRRQPTTIQEKVNLWSSFFNLCLALRAMQTSLQAPEVVHQDIRPQNILITNEMDDYRIHFKLTDFSSGHVVTANLHDRQSNIRSNSHLRGNGMYSAPEAYRQDHELHSGVCGCDMWSLGCIASEFLVWSLYGNDARLAYQAQRSMTTSKTPLAGGYYEGGFHDGHRLMKLVEERHRSLDIPDGDHISPAVSKFILDRMLTDSATLRSDADRIYSDWKGLMSDFVTEAGDLRASGLPSVSTPSIEVPKRLQKATWMLIKAYNFTKRTLESWLRWRFKPQLEQDLPLHVKVKDGDFVVNAPEELNIYEKRMMKRMLAGKEDWKPPPMSWEEYQAEAIKRTEVINQTEEPQFRADDPGEGPATRVGRESNILPQVEPNTPNTPGTRPPTPEKVQLEGSTQTSLRRSGRRR